MSEFGSGNARFRRREAVARVLALCALLLAGVACASTVTRNGGSLPAAVPRSAWRFPITSTTDSTVDFSASDAKWVRAGLTGYAVDPAHKDTFVATLSIVRASGNSFSALVTGQLRPVDTTHVVIVERPAPKLWRRREYWSGMITGAVAVAAAFVLAK